MFAIILFGIQTRPGYQFVVSMVAIIMTMAIVMVTAKVIITATEIVMALEMIKVKVRVKEGKVQGKVRGAGLVLVPALLDLLLGQ